MLFQLCHNGQCTYLCFPGVCVTSTLLNTLSKPLAAFPHNHYLNNAATLRDETELEKAKDDLGCTFLSKRVLSSKLRKKFHQFSATLF